MVAIPSRHRSLVLLAAILTAQVLLLAVQIRRGGQVRLVRVWAVSLVSPVQRAGAWVLNGIGGGWRHYIALHNATKENEGLKAELARLKLRNSELESRAAEAGRLGALLAFREANPDAPMLAARVISAGADAASRTLYIDRGSRDGIRRNMGVITPEGVVGKILDVYRNISQVQLLDDKDAGVGGMMATTRIIGPVRGTGESTLLFEHVSNDDQVPQGERVVTSGLDRIFPKDLPVGTVSDIKPGTPFKQIRLNPAVHLDRLEEVLVLLTLKELDTTKEKTPEPPAPAKAAAPAKGATQSQ